MEHTSWIHVLLVAARDPVSDWLIATLRASTGVVLAGWSNSLPAAMETANQRHVDIILLDTAVPGANQIEQVQALVSLPQEPAVILIVDPTDMAFVQQAIFAGARGFLLKPFTEAHLMESLRQTFATISEQRQALRLAPPAQAQRSEAKILAVYAPKGGAGSTSLAAGLSVALHQHTRKPVLLVDGDLQFGDIDIAMNAIPRTSIGDLFSYVDDLEPGLVEKAIIPHSSGVGLLMAPPHFDGTVQASETDLAHTLKMVAAAQEGYLVVDTPAGVGAVAMSLLEISHRVLLVAGPSLARLRATKRFLEIIREFQVPVDKIKLVLNGYRKEVDIPIKEIERHLDWPISAVVPGDSLAMSIALHHGQPIVLREPNHAVSKAILHLAQDLAGEFEEDAPSVPGEQPVARSRGLSGPAKLLNWRKSKLASTG